ncbi:ATP-binding protein [Blautia pseudococcoides]|uniref:ATP-binding protein n=1 Tax=Blautia pseudococcoides TaxID=1796616 RepID=UPI0035153800
MTTKSWGSECVLTVKNVNSSIPDEEIRHVFEPFYKVDKSRTGNGTGLGLYIVKSFLEYHDFRFSIANQESSVVFTIVMPLSV